MAESNQTTTANLAEELKCSTRQVLNYKESVEKFLGGSITRRQGKQHFYIPEFTDLLRKICRNEELPQELRGTLAQVEQISFSESRTVQVLPSDHPSLEVQNFGSAIAPIEPNALLFTAQSREWQRDELRQETANVASATFGNITGLQSLLRFQLIEGFKQAANINLRDAVTAYHKETTQGLEVVVTEAQKAGFSGSVEVVNVGKPGGEEENSFRSS